MSTRSAEVPGWALPLGAALALLTFAPLVLGGWREQQAFEGVRDESQHAALERLAVATEGNPLRVVALGQSLLRCATSEAAHMEALARRELGLDLTWARVVRSGGDTTDWALQARRVLAARPDLVLVEQRFLSLHERIDGFAARLRFLTRCARTQLRRLFVEPRAWSDERARALLAERFPSGEVATLEGLVEETRLAYERALERMGARGPGALLAELGSSRPAFPLGEFVLACRAAGIDVVVLEVPLHASAQRSGALSVALSDAATVELVAAHGLDPWGCELELDLGDYLHDRGHLSGSGRERYTRWLLARLAEYGALRR